MAEVVALGAWCDLVPPERYGGSPGGVSFVVHEFATLSDGRRLTLHTGRGFTSWTGTTDGQVLDPWTGLTRQGLEQDVLNVVLPDDDTEDEHPYAWLRDLLLRHGVPVTVAHLRSVPYSVELSERLQRRVPDDPAD